MMTTRRIRSCIFTMALALGVLPPTAACSARPCAAGERAEAPAAPQPEVRGTWITTTANSAIASPADTAATMKRLREIGLNTVYVETWKNGYTQYPSRVLRDVTGVDRRPALMKMDPSDPDKPAEARDLLEETLIEAHRNGLIYVAWFEYGFMAAHKDSNPHLRRLKPEWLSRDIKGSEVAPNGFVWMNPLHPGPRRFLLDIVAEAAANYDLDGVQLDDRIVWPYVTMGYDDFTRAAYAKAHNGQQPPADHKDPAWMRWRADHVNEYSKQFTQELRARFPGLLLSLSPAVYPWCWEFYLLEWPKWAAWTKADAYKGSPGWPGNDATPGWDEFIPQNYRFSYDAFEKTWLDQIRWMRELGADRQGALLPGIRLVGEGKDSTWDQLERSIALARSKGNGGHVHWFSRGVLEVFPEQLAASYAGQGAARNPHFPQGWREPSTPLALAGPGTEAGLAPGQRRWRVAAGVALKGNYRLIGHDGARWSYIGQTLTLDTADRGFEVGVAEKYARVELLRDRRQERSSLAAKR